MGTDCKSALSGFQNLNEFIFLFSWIKLNSISSERDKKRILKSIKNREAQILKKDVTKYIDLGNLEDTAIKFEEKGLFKIELK